ncbi:hypothetical protein J2Z69_003261 [Paenibacillus shirakamiensis]|uniref:Uncharacterized protein n=1 Tax=Paenibacillus shirakamiensis TaxID=1265935 RepID=A0ABS4JKG3_9BACL|nr:hypothetical protein [Paenibacillus shirakamiensis]MBP2002204.1 hypothetical protein [Paenibacillus shirakamiensis]
MKIWEDAIWNDESSYDESWVLNLRRGDVELMESRMLKSGTWDLE